MGRRLAIAAVLLLLLLTFFAVWRGAAPRPAPRPLAVSGGGREFVVAPSRPDAVLRGVDTDLRLAAFVATREDLVRRIVRPLGLPWGTSQREIFVEELREND